MGGTGIIPMPKGYLHKVYDIIHQHKGICISD